VTPGISSPHSVRRNAFALSGFALWIVALIPPVLTWAGRYEFVQALQFALFCLIVPYLLVAGGPWRWLGLTSDEPFQIDSDGTLVAPLNLQWFDRVARSMMMHKSHRRAVICVLLFMANVILWRLSSVVDTLVHNPSLAVLESFCLVAVGSLLWVELIVAPPFEPSATRPYRIGVSAVAMWTLWVMAYLMAMGQGSWYRAFHFSPGHWPSAWLDQMLTTGVLWFASAGAFLPVIFSNLNQWLKSEDDPDDELKQLIRRDRVRGFFGAKPS
jgi:cytochrome c oxidase assembly factor CtaG